MAARACAECAHARTRDTRSLRSLVGSPAAPTFPPQDATNTTKTINQHKQARKSLARSARSWAPLRLQHSHHKTQTTPSAGDTRSHRSLVGSPAAPHSLRLPRSLRSLGLPASSARGKPPHSVSRARERAAQSPIHLLEPYSLRCPSLSLAPLARCRSVPPACCRYGGSFGASCAKHLSTPLRSRKQAALRSNRLQAG